MEEINTHHRPKSRAILRVLDGRFRLSDFSKYNPTLNACFEGLVVALTADAVVLLWEVTGAKTGPE